MDFMSNIVQTEAPQLMDLRFLAVNTSDEFSTQGTPDNRIRNPTDGSHWYVPDHIFGKATAARMSATRLEQDYIYKTYFQILRKNQNFGRGSISISQPLLDSNLIGTKTTNITMPQFD